MEKASVPWLSVTDYINLCVDYTIHMKMLRCFPNNKPWINIDLKEVLENSSVREIVNN